MLRGEVLIGRTGPTTDLQCIRMYVALLQPQQLWCSVRVSWQSYIRFSLPVHTYVRLHTYVDCVGAVPDGTPQEQATLGGHSHSH